MKRGEIYYYYFADTFGCEQQGGRPGIIVSNDANNAHSRCVNIVPLTTKEKKDLPTHCTIRSMQQISTALAEQIETVDTERLGDYCATVTDQEMADVEACMMVQLGIGKPAWQQETAEQKPQPIGSEEARLLAEAARVVGERDAYKAVVDKLLKNVSVNQ